MSKKIQVGPVTVGGGAAVAIQSMCNTNTADVAATVSQILALEQAGCEIIRVAVPDMDSAAAIGAIKKAIHIPLVADIHFDYKLALRCAEDGSTRFASIPVISAATTVSAPWPMPAVSGASPSASVSTAARWKKTCWRNTAGSLPKRWWRVLWAMSAF